MSYDMYMQGIFHVYTCHISFFNEMLYDMYIHGIYQVYTCHKADRLFCQVFVPDIRPAPSPPNWTCRMTLARTQTMLQTSSCQIRRR